MVLVSQLLQTLRLRLFVPVFPTCGQYSSVVVFIHFFLLTVIICNQQVAGWPSGLRRQFKALVFGRGFESHFSQCFGETCDGTRLEGRSGPGVTSALIFAHTYHSKHTCQEGRVDVHHS